MQVPDKTRTVGFNQTQPLIATGQIRWALNNVAHDSVPPCTPTLLDVYNNPDYAEQFAVPANSFQNLTAPGTQVATCDSTTCAHHDVKGVSTTSLVLLLVMPMKTHCTIEGKLGRSCQRQGLRGRLGQGGRKGGCSKSVSVSPAFTEDFLRSRYQAPACLLYQGRPALFFDVPADETTIESQGLLPHLPSHSSSSHKNVECLQGSHLAMHVVL